MGFTEILNKLEQDFEEKKKEIESSWDSKIKAEKDSIDREIKDFIKQKCKEIEKSIEEKYYSILLDAKLAQRNAILKKKREMIENVFNEAFSQILNMDDDKYLQSLIVLISKYSETKSEKIALNENDNKKIGQKLIFALNKNGGNFSLYEEPVKVLKGAILKDEKNLVEINLSFEAIMKHKKDLLENHIGKSIHVI
jgi:vacuolar-type H+-ATPase subunit E/Vma4